MDNKTFSKKTLGYMLIEFKKEEEHKQAQLKQAAELLRGRMDRLITNLDEGSNFNNLGEVQALGTEVDRLIGELATIRKMMNRLPGLNAEAGIMVEVFPD